MNNCSSNRSTTRSSNYPQSGCNPCRTAHAGQPYANGRTSSYSRQAEVQSERKISRTREDGDSCDHSLEHMTQEELLQYINQISFVVSDMLLYLDTHPNDQKALDYCMEHITMRKHALKEYARLYGPLTIDTADDAASDSWVWVTTPWPWEGRMK